jgi:ribose 5-phosphate isomerase B
VADAFLSVTYDPAGRSADNVKAIDALDAKFRRA